MSDQPTSADPRLEQRIAQFENMTAADPDNDMAHFSLGNAYLQVGRAAEAATRFQRVIELNPDMSKAYQLAGEAMIEAGWEDKAVETLHRGWTIAATRGDLMVRDGIAGRLKAIGREVPTLSNEEVAEAERLAASGSFVCRRTGRPGSPLDAPPFRGPIGEWIAANISAETWRDWIGQGTKVINELRLDFSRDEDQETYDRHMREFLGIDDDLLASLGAG
jgi:Fe-S cluster biosynthesis and repair protein YggX